METDSHSDELEAVFDRRTIGLHLARELFKLSRRKSHRSISRQIAAAFTKRLPDDIFESQPFGFAFVSKGKALRVLLTTADKVPKLTRLSQQFPNFDILRVFQRIIRKTLC